MATFVMLTSLKADALKSPRDYSAFAGKIESQIKKHCPEVRWTANYSVLGPYDYLDVFEAPDNESATKVALLIRSFGHATTEIWPAVPWEKFESLAKEVAA